MTNKGPSTEASSSRKRKPFRRSHRGPRTPAYAKNASNERAPDPPSAAPNVAAVTSVLTPPVPTPNPALNPVVAPSPPPVQPSPHVVPLEHAEISALPPYSGRPPTRDPHVLGWEEYNRQAGRAKVFDELYFQINDDIQLMEDCMIELNSIFQRIRRQKEHLDHVYLKS